MAQPTSPGELREIAEAMWARYARMDPGTQLRIRRKWGVVDDAEVARRTREELTWYCGGCKQWRYLGAYNRGTGAREPRRPIRQYCVECTRAKSTRQRRDEHTRKNRVWTPACDATLRRQAGILPRRKIAAMLGRTECAVCARANLLGISLNLGPPPDLLTREELFDYLGVTQGTWRSWVELGVPRRRHKKALWPRGSELLDWLVNTRPELVQLYEIPLESISAMVDSTSLNFDPEAWLDEQREPPAFAVRTCGNCGARNAVDLYASKRYRCVRKGCTGRLPAGASAYLTEWPGSAIYTIAGVDPDIQGVPALSVETALDPTWPVHDEKIRGGLPHVHT